MTALKLSKNFTHIFIVPLTLSACATGYQSPGKSTPQAIISLTKSFDVAPESKAGSKEEIFMQQFFANTGEICENKKLVSSFHKLNSKKTLKIESGKPFNLYAKSDYVTARQSTLTIYDSSIKDGYSCFAHAQFIPKNGISYTGSLIDLPNGKCELIVLEDGAKSPPENLNITYDDLCQTNSPLIKP